MRGKCEHNVNFRVDDRMKDFIQDVCFRSGLCVSDLIRQSLILAAPTVMASPVYASRISLNDVRISNIAATREAPACTVREEVSDYSVTSFPPCPFCATCAVKGGIAAR